MIGVLFWLAPILYLAGAVAAVGLPRGRLVSLLSTILGGCAAFGAGVGVVLGEPGPAATVGTGLLVGPLTIALDPLGAFFLAVLGLVSAAAGLYAVGGLAWHSGQWAPRFHLAVLDLLLVSLVVLVSAGAGALRYTMPITIAIVVLLTVLKTMPSAH